MPFCPDYDDDDGCDDDDDDEDYDRDDNVVGWESGPDADTFSHIWPSSFFGALWSSVL